MVDYTVGLGLSNEKRPVRRKILLGTSLLVNLGLLGFFKYYNFFLESFVDGFSFFGASIDVRSLNIILPVGISFYTFQTLSYSIDVYRKKLKPTKNFIQFAAFVSFFPQLVAGPIERATNLLPQFNVKRKFNDKLASDGMRQILWGLFKKIVIADNCAEYANMIFNNSTDYSGVALLLGAILFAFQIYGDFSGYSDIAIGTSRLFGFHLMCNFRFPYFSRDIAEFWRRWHISLSTWFRDYLYIPLGGSRMGVWGKVRNTFIIFIVSGFWHGANWTFIVWGALNAIYFLPSLLSGKNRHYMETVACGKCFPSVREFLLMTKTFGLTVVAWIFFRASDLDHAFTYVTDLVFGLAGKEGYVQVLNIIYWEMGYDLPSLVIVFLLIEWLGRNGEHALSYFNQIHQRPFRFAAYYAIALTIYWFGGSEQEFIYFQF